MDSFSLVHNLKSPWSVMDDHWHHINSFICAPYCVKVSALKCCVYHHPTYLDHLRRQPSKCDSCLTGCEWFRKGYSFTSWGTYFRCYTDRCCHKCGYDTHHCCWGYRFFISILSDIKIFQPLCNGHAFSTLPGKSLQIMNRDQLCHGISWFRVLSDFYDISLCTRSTEISLTSEMKVTV